jgi:DNA-binding MarR family transcriptional regulator
MEKNELLNLEIRRKIYKYIKDNPGLHLHELARKLEINYHNLRYHLSCLEKNDIITIKTSNSYSRVYPNKICTIDKKLLNIIRQETPRNILLYLCYSAVCSQKELSIELERHHTTIEYHLKKLIDLDIIEPAVVRDGVVYTNLNDCLNVDKKPDKNEIFYRLKKPGLVLKILYTYKISLEKDKIFKICFEKYARDHAYLSKKKKIWQVKGFDYYIDYYIDILYDIFPHPYHV